jgi:3-dehydroquinate dehydratase type I
MTKICVSISTSELSQALEQIGKAEQSGAEALELWLGELNERDYTALRKATKLPLLANCKPPAEQGGFTGSDQDRFEILREAAKAGFEYVDFDYGFDADLLEEFIADAPSDCQLILSAHFFEGTPGLPALTRLIEVIQKNKPDIIKIAALATKKKDLITMLRLAEKLEKKSIKHIIISMGEIGKASRIIAPVLGSELMFAAIDGELATAPGQLLVKDLLNAYQML